MFTINVHAHNEYKLSKNVSLEHIETTQDMVSHEPNPANLSFQSDDDEIDLAEVFSRSRHQPEQRNAIDSLNYNKKSIDSDCFWSEDIFYRNPLKNKNK